MTPESGISKNQMIRELARSAHGALKEYVPTARRAASEDPGFLAHLIAWNEKHGQIRDSKVALPVVALSSVSDVELVENALAHLALLDPRNLVRALDFAREVRIPGQGKALKRTVERYLRVREANWAWWERTALQHRASLKALYSKLHLAPGDAKYQIILNHRVAKGAKRCEMPAGTTFASLVALKDMPAGEAAALLLEKRVPFLVAVGALGTRLREEDALGVALIDRMSPTEVVTNTKLLERIGMRTRPALRAAYELALERVAESKKVTLKTTRAAEAIDSEALKSKLQAAQEKQIDAVGLKGRWLVLADKSGSMQLAIETSRLIAATLARYAEAVHLIFFDVAPSYVNATGKTYEELITITRHVFAGGGTSIGCGLRYAIDKELDVDGIVIISDSAENSSPFFAETYQKYSDLTGGEPPVYLYKLSGETTNTLESSMERARLDLQIFDLRKQKVDFYSLPNLVQTMRVGRFSLIDEVMQTPLLKFADVFKGAAA
jgi:hypothetical protein